MTVDLKNGRQVIVSADLGTIRMTLWANRGSLGLQLTPEEAFEVAAMLIGAARKAKPPRRPARDRE
jgi:hypothetical protein